MRVRACTRARAHLGRVWVELERLVAVADGGVGLLELEVAVGALGVHQRRRHQRQHLREALDGLGVLAVARRLGCRHLELARLVHVRVRELGRRVGAHGRRRVVVRRPQVGVGGLRLVRLVVVVVVVIVVVAVLLLIVAVVVPAAAVVLVPVVVPVVVLLLVVVVLLLVVVVAAAATAVLVPVGLAVAVVMAVRGLLDQLRAELEQVLLEEVELRLVNQRRVGFELGHERLGTTQGRGWQISHR